MSIIHQTEGGGQARTTNPGPISPGRRTYALALLTAIYAAGYADRNIINLLLDQIKAEFHLSDTLLGLMTGLGFTLLQLVFIIPFARIADRGHRVVVLGCGLLLWSLMTGLSGLANAALFLAAARMGVGIGEACLVAPAQSILSDLYDTKSRPQAFAIMGAGADIGIVLGLVVGGWVAHAYGWRAAFYVAGVPGLILGTLMLTTIKEPNAPAMRPRAELPVGAALRELWGNPTCRNILLGGAVVGVHIFALQVWSPAFLRRVHHLSVAQIGAYTGGVRAAVSVIGAVLGGTITQHLAKYDENWRLRVPGLACMISGPAALAFLFLNQNWALFVAYGVSTMMIGIHLGPVFAALQSVVRREHRGLAAACFMLGTQLLGLGVGSLLVGALSDALTAHFGPEAMRYALILPAACGTIAGIMFWRTARSVPAAIRAIQ